MIGWPRKEIVFKRVCGYNVPLQPWPQKFYVTERAMMQWGRDEIEVRPITLTAIFKAVATNFVTMNWWRIVRLTRRAGFLNTSEGEVPRWRHLTPCFWKYRIPRRRKG